jgi:hypothetical protein
MALVAIGLGAAPAGANGGGSATKCNSTINGGTISGDVSVGNNAVCVLNNVTVTGSVSVAKGAYFESNGSNIAGTVSSYKALTIYIWGHSSVGGNVAAVQTAQVFVFDSTVGRNVAAISSVSPGYGHFQVCNTTAGQGIKEGFMGPDVLIGDPAAGCGGNTVTSGDFLAADNTANSELFVIGNTAKNGDIGVWFNSGSGPEQVTGNTAPNGDLFCNGNPSGFVGSPNGAVGDVSGPQCSAAPLTGNDVDD